MTRKNFALYSSLFTALFVALIAGFPLLRELATQMTGCAVDTCGATGLILALMGRIAPVLVYALVMLTIIAGRCSRAGFSVLWTLACFLWLLAAYDFLLSQFNVWSIAFSPEILSAGSTVTLYFFAAFVIFLCLWRGVDENRGGALTIPWRFAGISAFISVMLSAAICIPLVASSAWIVGLPSPTGPELLYTLTQVLSIRFGEHWISYIDELWILLAVFVTMLTYLILDQRRADRRSMSSDSAPV